MRSTNIIESLGGGMQRELDFFNSCLTEGSNFDTFMHAYEKHLTNNHEKHPEIYAWPRSELPKVLERMKDAIERGSFNKDGPAIKMTCKELGIPYTYKAIKEFISK